jgi:beta-glucosidase
VNIAVKNIGTRSGEEVVQLYIRDKISSTVRPVKELKGFQKIHINPGEIKQLQFILTDKELGFYNGEGQFLVEKGEFEVMVGTNSQDLLKTVFTKK